MPDTRQFWDAGYNRLIDTYFQFHGSAFHLVLVLFVPLRQKYGIPCRLTFCGLKHSLHLDVI